MTGLTRHQPTTQQRGDDMTTDKSAAPERLETLLRELITEQSCGEWDDKTIDADVQKFLPRILALIDTPAPPTPAEPAGNDGWIKKSKGSGIIFTHPDVEGAVVYRLGYGITAATGGDVTWRGKDFPTVVAAKAAALAAAPAPQPVQMDREALVGVINDAQLTWNPVTTSSTTHIADALLARGLRLPTGEGEVK